MYTIARRLCIDESRKIRFLPLEEEKLVKDHDEIRQVEDRAEIGRLLQSYVLLLARDLPGTVLWNERNPFLGTREGEE